MIANQLVTILQSTISKTSEGLTVNTYSPLYVNYNANVQPMRLTQSTAKAWGLTDIQVNIKLMFCDYDPTLHEGMRVISDDNCLYDIRGINHWNFSTNHSELLLVPVQGEQYLTCTFFKVNNPLLVADVVATVNGRNISATFPAGTVITALKPTIYITNYLAMTPASGSAQNFTNPVTYSVSIANGQPVKYVLTVAVSP